MRIPILLLIATLMAACTKEVDMIMPFEGEQLVVNGLLAPEQVITVSVSRTAPVVGPIQNDLAVENATVSLFQKDQLVEELQHTGGGAYTSPSEFAPQVGQTYHFVIERADGEKLVTGHQTVPSVPVVADLRYQAGAVLPLNDSSKAGGLYLTVVDTLPQGFYAVDVRGFRFAEEVAINVWALNETEEVASACGFVGGDDTFDFSKSCFADNVYRAQYGVETTGFLKGEEVDCTRLEVSVAKISEDYYQYLETSVQPEGIDLAFTEPQVVFSNVLGGYGIVGAAHPVTFTIEL